MRLGVTLAQNLAKKFFMKGRQMPGRFEDDNSGDTWKTMECRDPEHKPPGLMVIAQGKRYVHVCPTCKQETVIRPSGARL